MNFQGILVEQRLVDAPERCFCGTWRGDGVQLLVFPFTIRVVVLNLFTLKFRFINHTKTCFKCAKPTNTLLSSRSF